MTSEPAIPDELVRVFKRTYDYTKGTRSDAVRAGLAAVLAVAGHSDTEEPHELAHIMDSWAPTDAELDSGYSSRSYVEFWRDVRGWSDRYNVARWPGVVGVPAAQPANDEDDRRWHQHMVEFSQRGTAQDTPEDQR